MPKMPRCMPDPFTLGKNYAGDPYAPGDIARCVYCGRLFIVEAEQIASDGKLTVPLHTYPTKVELKHWRREGMYEANRRALADAHHPKSEPEGVTPMPLTSRKPDTLEAVLDLVRQAVDTAHASALRTMARTSSGVPQARTLAAQGQAKAAYDALLQLLEDIDPRYGVTAQRLGEESFERIGGAEIVEQDRRERARLNPQARRAARG